MPSRPGSDPVRLEESGVMAAIFDYFEVFYNRVHRHSGLKYLVRRRIACSPLHASGSNPKQGTQVMLAQLSWLPIAAAAAATCSTSLGTRSRVTLDVGPETESPATSRRDALKTGTATHLTPTSRSSSSSA
mgnify:CR=1 FL=1